MILTLILGLVVLAAIFAIVVSRQPTGFTMTRTAVISAPPAIVFTQVNEFRRWETWSPWAKLDPRMQTAYEGPAAGVGAMYSWSGNAQVGKGRMTIVESQPAALVRLKLEFLKPMPATNSAEFTFRTEGGQTVVSWSMSCQRNFVMKAMNLLMNLEKMIAKQFDQGLAQLKTVSEAAAKSGVIA